MVRYAVKARLDYAWDVVARKEPFVRDVLIGKWGFCKTGEDVREYGQVAIIYYECDEDHQAAVRAYLQKGAAWLGHQMGNAINLRRRPRFRFVHDGLSSPAADLLDKLTAATIDVHNDLNPSMNESASSEAQGDNSSIASSGGRQRRRPRGML